jgi:hypothetical protein
MASLRALVSEVPKAPQSVEEQKQTSTARKELTADQHSSISELQKIFTSDTYENIKNFVLQFSTHYEIEEAVRKLLDENMTITDSLSNWSEVTNKYKKSKQVKSDRGGKKGSYARRQDDGARAQEYRKDKPVREDNYDRNTDTSRRNQRGRNNPNYQRRPKYKPRDQPSATFEQPSEVFSAAQVSKESEFEAPVPETQPAQPVAQEQEVPTTEKKPEPLSEFPARKSESAHKYSVFEENEANSFVDSHKASKGYGIFGSVLKDVEDRGVQTEEATRKEIGIQAGVMIGGIPCMIYPQRPEDFARLREMLFATSSS